MVCERAVGGPGVAYYVGFCFGRGYGLVVSVVLVVGLWRHGLMFAFPAVACESCTESAPKAQERTREGSNIPRWRRRYVL